VSEWLGIAAVILACFLGFGGCVKLVSSNKGCTCAPIERTK
jgi:hypothetical protein